MVFHGFAEAQEKPNVILIISDDQGFPDYGFMRSKMAKTPNLDKIASESLLYTRGYVMPVCSPSLATLLTGKMPHEHGITGNDLAEDRKSRDPVAKKLLGNSLTLPKAVTDAGYLSFQTGKLWNVTFKDVGFTQGMTDTAGRHGDAGLTIGRKGMKPVFDFIETAKAEKKPFFIWYAPLLPHDPHTPPERIFKKYKGKGLTEKAEKYFAMVEWFDETCGELGVPEKSLTSRVVVDGWWKLIVPGPMPPARPFAGVPARVSLFDLKSDPLEKSDVSAEHSEIVERLKVLLKNSWNSND